MNILRCHIRGFGKFTNLDFSFCPGLNLVFAPNEAGKSTLQHFLLALLYGQLRDDLPHQRRLEVWVEQFKPWGSADYGGTLWCGLAGGQELEVIRNLGREESRIEVRASSGEEITAEYERRRNGDVLFARSHIGIPKELFESVAVIRENNAGAFHGPENIQERIANLAQTGDEALSVSQSLKKLADLLEDLGSDRAPTKPYRTAKERLRALREEKERLGTRWVEFQEWVQERNAYAEELVRLEQEAHIALAQLTAARWKESTQKIAAIEKMEVELGVLRQEIAAGSEYESFPAHLSDELDRLVMSQTTHRDRLDEIRRSLVHARGQVDEAAEKRRELAVYEAVDSVDQPEGVTELLVRYRSLSSQIQDIERGVARMKADRDALDAGLEKLGPSFREPEVDWQRKAQEANDAEREANQRHMAIAEQLAGRNEALLAERSAGVRSRTWATAGVAASLVLAAAALLLPSVSPTPAVVFIIASVAFAAASALLFRASSRSAASAKAILAEIQRMKAEQDRLKETAQKGHFEIGIASTAAGFRDVKEFLAAAQRAGEIQRRLESLRVTAAEAEQLRIRLSDESATLFGGIQEVLARVELDCSTEDFGEKVDVLRENLKRFRSADAEYRNQTEREKSLLGEESRFLEECNQAALRVQEILQDAGQTSPESFKASCRKHRLLSALRQKEVLLLREYEARCEDRTLEEWKERRDHLRDRLQDLPGAGAEQPPVEEAERREREVASLLASCRENHSRLVERIGQAFRDTRTASEIDEDIAQAEEELSRVSKNREALTITLETLEELSRRQQENLAPRLNRAVEQRFIRLCCRRYHEVKIEPDFHVLVRETGSGELRGAESLSRGTQDQLYFALRFGVLDLISRSGESCPSLLDEPFAAYDRSRLEEAFKILQEEASHRQLFLFTCRDDLRDLGRSHGALVLELP